MHILIHAIREILKIKTKKKTNTSVVKHPTNTS